jgi:hypothetical protein
VVILVQLSVLATGGWRISAQPLSPFIMPGDCLFRLPSTHSAKGNLISFNQVNML